MILYSTNFFLPESQSLYAIKDTETNEFVIDFDCLAIKNIKLDNRINNTDSMIPAPYAILIIMRI